MANLKRKKTDQFAKWSDPILVGSTVIKLRLSLQSKCDETCLFRLSSKLWPASLELLNQAPPRQLVSTEI